jgi:hypothetical protein
VDGSPAGADRDVSEVRAELRAHTRAISALRQTQVDVDRRLSSMERTTREGLAEVRTEMRAGFTEMRTGFAEVHDELGEMRAGFATVHAGMAQIVNLLEDEDPASLRDGGR